MPTETLDALEKRTYLAAVDHGFFDLLLACAVTIFTLVVAVSAWFVLLLFPLVIFKQPMLKRFEQAFVEPRTGHVRLAAVRLDRISTARKTAALVFLGLVFIAARLGDLDWPILGAAPFALLADTPQAQIAILIGLGTAIAGWLFQMPRFIGYGIVIVSAPLLAAIADLPAGTGWAFAACIVLAAGVGVMVRFDRSNAVDHGDANGS